MNQRYPQRRRCGGIGSPNEIGRQAFELVGAVCRLQCHGYRVHTGLDGGQCVGIVRLSDRVDRNGERDRPACLCGQCGEWEGDRPQHLTFGSVEGSIEAGSCSDPFVEGHGDRCGFGSADTGKVETQLERLARAECETLTDQRHRRLSGLAEGRCCSDRSDQHAEEAGAEQQPNGGSPAGRSCGEVCMHDEEEATDPCDVGGVDLVRCNRRGYRLVS